MSAEDQALLHDAQRRAVRIRIKYQKIKKDLPAPDVAKTSSYSREITPVEPAHEKQKGYITTD
jgi:hypothetical protein